MSDKKSSCFYVEVSMMSTMNERWRIEQTSLHENRSGDNLVRYFIHGIPFAIQSFLFVYLLGFVLMMMVTSNLTEMLILLLVMTIGYLITIGGVNTFVTELVWKTRVRKSITSLLGQGVLFTFMQFLIIPVLDLVIIAFAATMLFGIGSFVVAFFILALAGGYIGRNVAVEFADEPGESEELASIHDRHVTCPHCGAQSVVGPSQLDTSGGINCPQCGQWFQVADTGLSIK